MFTGQICCKRCSFSSVYKNGKSGILNQRYKCIRCNYTFVQFDGRTSVEKHKKRVAVFFTYYELGISIRKIAIFLKLKEKIVQNWIRKEEKSFKDDGYRDIMIFCRSKNYYYNEIRDLLDMVSPYDKDYYYNNGNKIDCKKFEEKDNFLYETTMISRKILYYEKSLDHIEQNFIIQNHIVQNYIQDINYIQKD